MGDEPQLPKGSDRALTPGEIELAKSVYGDSIDYSRVRVHNDTYTMFQSQFTTVTPNGQLYCAGNYCDDFSKGDTHHFLHEMAHVWQYQNNVLSPRIAAAKQLVATGFSYQRAYDYKPDPSKDLTDYNLEQQADMIADWYFARQRLANPPPPAPPVTVEALEQNPFTKMQLKALEDLRRKEPNSPMLAWAKAGGQYEFDSEGRAHFTQKYADKATEQNRRYEAEQKADDRNLAKCMEKFSENPSYARRLTLLEKAELGAAITVIEVAPRVIGPLMDLKR